MKTDTETFWQAMLSIIRAVVLGRRLPPDQLRMFLLFADPVEGLTPREVAELLNWKRDFTYGTKDSGYQYCGPEFEEEIPKDWTIAFALFDPDEESYADRWDTQMISAAMSEALTAHPEWMADWKVFNADNGAQLLGYRVLDARGRVHPVACFMEARRKLLRDGELEISKEIQRNETLEFLAYSIEWMFESIDDQLAEGCLEEDDDLVIHRLLNTLRPVDEYEVARWIYDHDEWDVDYYMGPQTYIKAIDRACAALGCYPDADYRQPAAKQRGLFAA